MKKVLWLIVYLMTMVTSVNAQNSIVDEFKTYEPSKEYDTLLLDPNKSIKENYAKIDSLMSLHKEKNFAEYTIMVDGHYTNKYNDSYNSHLGMIQVKEFMIIIDGHYTNKHNDSHIEMIKVKENDNISGQIIYVLTELYSHSLDTPFNVGYGEYSKLSVNKKRIKVKTGRTFKRSDGKVTKEYVEREIGGNTLYYLYSSSSLYKHIYNKVIEETGLKEKSMNM